MRNRSDGEMVSRSRQIGATRHATLLAGAVVAILAAASTATAHAGQSEIAVTPLPVSHTGLSYFDVQASAGTRALAGAIEVRNPGRSEVTVLVRAVAGETLSTLGSAYAQPGKGAPGPAKWISVSSRRVKLPPKTATRLPVYVQIPRRARAGDYLGGVSIEQLGQGHTSSTHGGMTIASASRYAIGVEMQVPGARHPRIVFTGAQLRREPAGLTFLLLARNEGNVILKGVHGQVTVKQDRRTVLARTIESGTFVSGTSIAYPVNAFAEHAKEGTRYALSAWLRYPGGVAKLSSTVVFGKGDAAIQARYGKPSAPGASTAWWKIAGLIGIGLYSAFTTVLLVRRKRRRPLAAPTGNTS